MEQHLSGPAVSAVFSKRHAYGPKYSRVVPSGPRNLSMSKKAPLPLILRSPIALASTYHNSCKFKARLLLITSLSTEFQIIQPDIRLQCETKDMKPMVSSEIQQRVGRGKMSAGTKSQWRSGSKAPISSKSLYKKSAENHTSAEFFFYFMPVGCSLLV